MTKEYNISENGVSWLDVYWFIRVGWKVILGFSAVGLAIALVIATVLPQQPKIYLASGAIKLGEFPIWHVTHPRLSNGKHFILHPLRNRDELIQEMQQEDFYSTETIKECGFEDTTVGRQNLVNNLTILAPPNNKDILVNFSASSPAGAKRCLDGILRDVIFSEKKIHSDITQSWEQEIRKIENILKSLEDDKNQKLALIQKKIDVSKVRINSAEEFISKHSHNQLPILSNALSAQSTTSLLNDKRNQIDQLEMRIDALENSKVNITFAYFKPIKELNEELIQLRTILNLPSFNRIAEFINPISISEKRTFPKKQALIISSFIASILLGVLFLLSKHLIRKIRLDLKTVVSG